VSTDSFRDFVLEQLAGLGDLRCKRMFGGHGLSTDGIFFSILFDGRLYFRTHPDTLPGFPARNAPVFASSEKQILKNYREVPPEILEDSDFCSFGRRKQAGNEHPS
jgi:DNA transformation protein